MADAAYWKKRFEQLEETQNRKGLQCYEEVERLYRDAQRQIEGQIASWYQRFANNNGITLADARRMLNSKELEEFKWSVQDYIKYGRENAKNGMWVKQLENASARYHISRLEALKLHTQQCLEVMFGNQLDTIDTTMRDIYKSGYYHTAFEIQKGAGVGWDFATLDEKKISKVISKPWAADGKNFSERVWGNRQKLVNELHTELTRNIILGQAPQKAINAIAKRMNVSKSNAKRLVMTESAFFNSAARHDSFAELDVEEYEILVSYDKTTCDICQVMEGKHFLMSQWEVGVTAPPFHVNCRCDHIPYFHDEFSAMGTKAARDKNGKTVFIPANMTYEDWEKSFVGGDKTGLQEMKLVENPKGMGYTKRTKEEFEHIANDAKSEITTYSSNPSKWSGTVHVKQDLINGDAVGVKEWSCDISIMDTADDGVVWHEMLHSCSASYYDSVVYAAHEYIEEASVEFLTQQICDERGVLHEPAYLNIVPILKAVNDSFNYGSDLEFAKELFNVPLPERYQWLEDKVDESLRAVNASFQDYNEVMKFLESLKGGRYGTIK